MTEALLKKSRVSPFTVLMGTISRQLGGEHLRRLKILLGGHINKENLSSLQCGFDLIHVLQKRGLVTEKKLSFIRKLLQDCELFSLVELLDEYKQTFQDMDGKTGNLQCPNYALNLAKGLLVKVSLRIEWALTFQNQKA